MTVTPKERLSLKDLVVAVQIARTEGFTDEP
jgi:hypothetical protein